VHVWVGQVIEFINITVTAIVTVPTKIECTLWIGLHTIIAISHNAVYHTHTIIALSYNAICSIHILIVKDSKQVYGYNTRERDKGETQKTREREKERQAQLER
jgi:hypothetical protein